MYGFNGYVCENEDKWNCDKSGNSIIVSNTAAGLCREPDEEPHVHQIEPLKHEVHSCSPSTSASVLDKQTPGRYKLFKEQNRETDFSLNLSKFLRSSAGLCCGGTTDLQSPIKRPHY